VASLVCTGALAIHWRSSSRTFPASRIQFPKDRRQQLLPVIKV
jgi:hypothetical protein